MKKLAYIGIIFALFACRKQVEIAIPELEPSLTVNSVLCLDSLIRVELSYTQSITDNQPVLKETKALIELYNKDSVLLETLTNEGNGYYTTIATKAIPSLKYILKIITPKLTYWTSDSVPAGTDSKLVSVDSINFHNNPYFFQITYQMRDKGVFQNFYGFKLKHCYEVFSATDTVQKEEWLDIETKDPILTEDVNSKFSKKHLIFTDRYFNNMSIFLELGTSKVFNNSSGKSRFLILYLDQYTYDGYRYYTTLNEHIFYQNDPFSQPINVEGNIGNAFGAFTGKSTNNDTISFKF